MDRTQSDQLDQAEDSFCAWWGSGAWTSAYAGLSAIPRLHARVAFYAGHKAAMDYVNLEPEEASDE